MSEQQALQRLAELKLETTSIYESLQRHEGTVSQKIEKLAEIIEERINLADQEINIPVYCISEWIADQIRPFAPKTASNIRHYVKEKYRNPALSRKCDKIESDLSILEQLGGILYRQNIEESSKHELIDFIAKCKNAKNDADKISTFFGQLTNKGRDRAIQLGLLAIEELGEKYRTDISAKKYKFEVPENMEDLNKGIVYWLKRQAKAWNTFAHTYEEYPATVEEDGIKYFNVAKTMCLSVEACSDFKWSGEYCFWFDREYWKNVQSAHYAGNSTFHNCSVCEYCSENIESDPDDYHLMKYDKSSPTGMLCDRCNGTKAKERFVSRENVTDKEHDIFRMAYNVMQFVPGYPDLMQHCRNKYFNPPINTRKLAIASKFEAASMGTDTTYIKKENR